jgi:hypothetical protein
MDPETVTMLVDAVQGGHWAVLVGLALTVLVWVARRMLGPKKLPSSAIPIVNVVIGVVVAIADLLIRGQPWYEALGTGLLVSAAAGGFWGMLGKHLLPLPDADEEK